MKFLQSKKSLIFSFVFLIFLIGFVSYQFSLSSVTQKTFNMQDELIEANQIYFLLNDISSTILDVLRIDDIELIQNQDFQTITVTGTMRPFEQENTFLQLEENFAQMQTIRPGIDLNMTQYAVDLKPFGYAFHTTSNTFKLDSNQTFISNLSLTMHLNTELTNQTNTILQGTSEDTNVLIHIYDSTGFIQSYDYFINLSEDSNGLLLETLSNEIDIQFIGDSNIIINGSDYTLTQLSMTKNTTQPIFVQTGFGEYKGIYYSYSYPIFLFSE